MQMIVAWLKMHNFFSKTKLKNNKTMLDIRLHLRCAIPPPPLRQIGRIACVHKFSEYYLLAWHIEWFILLHDAIGDWMIAFAANAATTLLRRLQRRLPMLLNSPDSSWKMPLPLGGSSPHLVHGSLGPPESSSKTARRSVKPVLRSSPYSVHLLYIGPLRFPPKLPRPLGGSGPHL